MAGTAALRDFNPRYVRFRVKLRSPDARLKGLFCTNSGSNNHPVEENEKAQDMLASEFLEI
jgi:hypothetical protein